MAIVYFLVILLVLLIVYTMISTIIKLSLYLTTRVKYENIRLVIPFILTILVWALVISVCIFSLNKYIDGNIFSQIMETYILKQSLIPLLKPTIIFIVVYLLIGIVLQSLTYFAVNIKLENCFSYIRYYICKLLKFLKLKLNIKTKQKPENIVEKEPIEELTLNTAILASFLSTILIIFSLTLFIVIGLTIANKLGIQ